MKNLMKLMVLALIFSIPVSSFAQNGKRAVKKDKTAVQQSVQTLDQNAESLQKFKVMKEQYFAAVNANNSKAIMLEKSKIKAAMEIEIKRQKRINRAAGKEVVESTKEANTSKRKKVAALDSKRDLKDDKKDKKVASTILTQMEAVYQEFAFSRVAPKMTLQMVDKFENLMVKSTKQAKAEVKEDKVELKENRKKAPAKKTKAGASFQN